MESVRKSHDVVAGQEPQQRADFVYQQRFEVRFEYPVYFTRDALSLHNPLLHSALTSREPNKQHRIWLAVDEGVWRSFPALQRDLQAYTARHPHLELCGTPFVVPGGEAAKNDPELIVRIHAELQRAAIDRHSFVLAIGGGAVLDAVGFAASTAHRGIRLVRMPSTVLAQNDAGVGVKDSVNRLGAKNFLGTFSPPFAVINDSALLRTLPARDLLAGMAEAVKVALIRDAPFFDWLVDNAARLRHFEPAALEVSIQRAATIHLRHIAEAGDPFERGSARPLDFGHWAAHKLESLTQHALRHGEAVAIGMALDTRYSELQALISSEQRAAIFALLEQLGFTLWHEALAWRNTDGTRQVLAGLAEFREHMGGELNIPLLAGIGRTREARSMDPAQLEAALAWLELRGTTEDASL